MGLDYIDMYLLKVKSGTYPDNRIAYHFSPIHPSYSKTQYMFNSMFEYVSLTIMLIIVSFC